MDGIQLASSPSDVLSRLWLKRQKDAVLLNEIFNHPGIFPHVNFGMAAPLDVSWVFADHRNVAFASPQGAVVFHCRMPGIYEMHTGVLPGARGTRMIEGSRQAFYYMFTQTECAEILTHCPAGNSNAKAGAKLAGLRHLWTGDGIYPSGGRLVDSDIFGMTIYDWWLGCPFLAQIGAWFHDELTRAVRDVGVNLTPHTEDRNHNKIVGAAVAMIHGKHPLKGVSLYNRWASMNLHPLVSIVSFEPLVIDIHNIKLLVHADRMEVIECR